LKQLENIGEKTESPLALPKEIFNLTLHDKTMFSIRIQPALDLIPKSGDGPGDLGGKLRVLFNETWHEFLKHAQQIMADQHLTVALRSGPDADGSKYLR